MNRSLTGVLWACAFVLLEAIQYVYFGSLFQRMSSYLFGALVFAVTVVLFVGWAAINRPEHLRAAFANPRILLAVNASATFAWAAYLTSVQLIEPAIAYTIGAGVMPLTAYVCWRLGVPEGEPMRNRTEALGNLLLCAGLVYMCIITVAGLSGFVRGGANVAMLGLACAVADGVLFTWMLIYCQRLDRVGVGPGTVFGLRFPLYVVVAAALAAAGFDHKEPMPGTSEIGLIVVLGLALVIPPLFALQKAVAAVSTMTIGALTALGPFVIFVLQMIEGRVAYSSATLVGLTIYFAGAILAAVGAASAAVENRSGGA